MVFRAHPTSDATLSLYLHTRSTDSGASNETECRWFPDSSTGQTEREQRDIIQSDGNTEQRSVGSGRNGVAARPLNGPLMRI